MREREMRRSVSPAATPWPVAERGMNAVSEKGAAMVVCGMLVGVDSMNQGVLSRMEYGGLGG